MRDSGVSERTSGGRDRSNETEPGWTGLAGRESSWSGRAPAPGTPLRRCLPVQPVGRRWPAPSGTKPLQPMRPLPRASLYVPPLQMSPRAEKGRMRRAHGRLELNLEARGSRLGTPAHRPVDVPDGISIPCTCITWSSASLRWCCVRVM
ncbi:hypothetical protein CPLU01_03660 [Colletotrichum plurivorum]|uniref:Uncharacterized protein n=1 Tax=Colletotrichum plurivorum TaxID=2175906 RepID=A0A8H6KSC0_9PEZI|nr:hypothetical protein CPLU01_03660 [Colletotrichum plurivorum]